MAEHNELGKIGENIAASFLMKQGFKVLERNYRTPFGEIDIITEKDKKLRFVEVKSVKVRSLSDVMRLPIQPQENITARKWNNLVTSVAIYLKHRTVSSETRWQIDLACVYIDTEKREGRAVLVENIHKE